MFKSSLLILCLVFLLSVGVNSEPPSLIVSNADDNLVMDDSSIYVNRLVFDNVIKSNTDLTFSEEKRANGELRIVINTSNNPIQIVTDSTNPASITVQPKSYTEFIFFDSIWYPHSYTVHSSSQHRSLDRGYVASSGSQHRHRSHKKHHDMPNPDEFKW